MTEKLSSEEASMDSLVDFSPMDIESVLKPTLLTSLDFPTADRISLVPNPDLRRLLLTGDL